MHAIVHSSILNSSMSSRHIRKVLQASHLFTNIEFSKAEYARPTKAELAHCTTSSRSSKYAQSQKLSSLTSQYRIFPQVHPTLTIPSNLPRTKEAPVRDITHAAPSASTETTRSLEEEARDILATAAKNQAEDGPNTRRAAVRACKCLRATVNQYSSIIQEVHKAARIHTQLSKGTAGSTTQHRPQGRELPVSPELTSELLHCLSTLANEYADEQEYSRQQESRTSRQHSRRSRKSSQSLRQE